ncbi:hypothetical protein QQX98_009542 [Neonectria punicea]|uniref:Uncharacterized protein n=1 Tax=Neonectria punicea TaxID=979145 RepID=A0ABR1GSA7_9HYPO
MLIITNSSSSNHPQDQQIPRYDNHIPYTFSMNLQPLAVHVMARQHGANSDTMPTEFARERSMAVAMVLGTTERLRRERRGTPGWDNPTVAPYKPAQWRWQVLCPPGAAIQSDAAPAEDRAREVESREIDRGYTVEMDEAKMIDTIIRMVDSGLGEPAPVEEQDQSASVEE